jgi:membrane associated rhomboid family serine protease
VIPISDKKRTGKFPLITISLILINIFIFLFTFSNLDFYIQKYGFIPKEIEGGRKLYTFLSSLFIHAGLSHLIGNLWFLWIFGDNVEAKIGRIKFLILYFLSGFFSLILFSLTAQNKTIPVVGASGAISGVLGAYLIFFPKNKIKALVPVFYFYRIVSIPAIFYIGIWFLYQFLLMPLNPSVAYWGHIGGFLTGIILAKIFQNKDFKF